MITRKNKKLFKISEITEEIVQNKPKTIPSPQTNIPSGYNGYVFPYEFFLFTDSNTLFIKDAKETPPYNETKIN